MTSSENTPAFEVDLTRLDRGEGFIEGDSDSDFEHDVGLFGPESIGGWTSARSMKEQKVDPEEITTAALLRKIGAERDAFGASLARVNSMATVSSMAQAMDMYVPTGVVPPHLKKTTSVTGYLMRNGSFVSRSVSAAANQARSVPVSSSRQSSSQELQPPPSPHPSQGGSAQTAESQPIDSVKIAALAAQGSLPPGAFLRLGSQARLSSPTPPLGRQPSIQRVRLEASNAVQAMARTESVSGSLQRMGSMAWSRMREERLASGPSSGTLALLTGGAMGKSRWRAAVSAAIWAQGSSTVDQVSTPKILQRRTSTLAARADGGGHGWIGSSSEDESSDDDEGEGKIEGSSPLGSRVMRKGRVQREGLLLGDSRKGPRMDWVLSRARRHGWRRSKFHAEGDDSEDPAGTGRHVNLPRAAKWINRRYRLVQRFSRAGPEAAKTVEEPVDALERHEELMDVLENLHERRWPVNVPPLKMTIQKRTEESKAERGRFWWSGWSKGQHRQVAEALERTEAAERAERERKKRLKRGEFTLCEELDQWCRGDWWLDGDSDYEVESGEDESDEEAADLGKQFQMRYDREQDADEQGRDEKRGGVNGDVGDDDDGAADDDDDDGDDDGVGFDVWMTESVLRKQVVKSMPESRARLAVSQMRDVLRSTSRFTGALALESIPFELPEPGRVNFGVDLDSD